MTHEMRREHGGVGNLGWIEAVCSCGWRSKREYAYNDYQLSNIQIYETEHRREILRNVVQKN